MPGQAAGVDLGGTKVQGVIVDKAGNPLASAVASTPSGGGPASVVEQVAAVVRAAAANAGRTPMERAVRKAVETGRPTDLPAIQRRLGRARLTTDVLAEGLALGDALAGELVELAARALGTAIGSACNVLDVQGVLLGGGLIDGLGDPFVRQVERTVTPRLLTNEPPLDVRRTALGDMAGAIGAALLVHEPPPPS